MFAQHLESESALRSLLLTIGLLTLGVAAGFVVCLFSDPFINCIPDDARNRFTENKIVRQVRRVMSSYRENAMLLLTAVGISLLANFLLVFVTILGALTVASSSWTPRMFFVIPIGHIANSLPLTPGGLGVGETAFNALFDLAGLRGGAEALLCTRIWMAMVGLIGFAFYLRGIKREVFDELVRANEPCSTVLGTMKS